MQANNCVVQLGSIDDGDYVARHQALRAVVLHEFGHLLGLAHVTDPSEVMYPEAHLSVTDYSAGDLRGLHAVSTGPCIPLI